MKYENIYNRINELCMEYVENKKRLNIDGCKEFYRSIDVIKLEIEKNRLIMEKNLKYNAEYDKLRNKFFDDKAKLTKLLYLVIGCLVLSTSLLVFNEIILFLIIFISSILSGKYIVKSIDRMDRKYLSDKEKIGKENNCELEELEKRLSLGLYTKDMFKNEIELINNYLVRLEEEIVRLVIKGYDLLEQDNIVFNIDSDEYRDFMLLIAKRRNYDKSYLFSKRIEDMDLDEFIAYREMLNINKEITYYVVNNIYIVEEKENIDKKSVNKILVRKRNGGING